MYTKSFEKLSENHFAASRETTFLDEIWSNSAGWDVCKIKDYMSLEPKVNTDSLQSHKTLECRKEHKKVDGNLMWKQWDQCIKSLPIVVGRCCNILSFTSSLIFDACICAIIVMMRVAGRPPHPFSPIRWPTRWKTRLQRDNSLFTIRHQRLKIFGFCLSWDITPESKETTKTTTGSKVHGTSSNCTP